MRLLDRCALVAEWVGHAEAKASVYDQIVAKPQGGRPEGGIRRAASGELPIPGKTFLGRRKYIERAIKIDGIREEAKSAARAAGLDNTQCDLLAIAQKQSLEGQLAKLRDIAARRAAPRRKSSKPTPPGAMGGTKLRTQDAVHIPELVVSDQAMTAEQEAQLANLRTSWRIDKVLRREEFENASAVTRGCFIRDDLLAAVTEQAKKIEDEGSAAEVATVAPSQGQAAGRGLGEATDASPTRRRV